MIDYIQGAFKVMKKEKIVQLSYYRALAILAVLLIHATSETIIKAKTSNLYFGYVLINTFAKFAVPSFIMLTGFVLFYNYAGEKFDSSRITSFYKKRLKYIVAPYTICSICYFIFVQFINGTTQINADMFASFINKLISGRAYTHLYFIIILIQFYLLFPFHLMATRVKSFVKYSVIIGLALQWAFVLLNKYFIHYNQKGSLFLNYASFWMLGAYLGMNWDLYKHWLQSLFSPAATKRHRYLSTLLWMCWLVLGLIHTYVWYANYLGQWQVNSLYYEALFNIYGLLSALVLIQLSFFIHRYGQHSGVRLLAHLGEMSFGVYLLHPIILFFYRKYVHYGAAAWTYPVYIFGGFMTALLIPWLIVTLVSKWIPFSWVIFGSPQQKKPLLKKREITF